MVTYIPLSLSDLGIPAALILLIGLLSLRLKLGIAKPLLVAAARMAAQLVLIAYVLALLFRAVSPFWTAVAAAVMLGFAGREIAARQKRRMHGGWGFGIGFVTVLVAGTSMTAIALVAPIRPDPWYHPQFALPLLGMILGNAMTGISLGLDLLANGLVRERAAVEARLALGATRWVAMLPVTRDAIRGGMMPTINAMAAIGLVSLPGMMTGQILAGVSPEHAVRYQILIMFLIAAATGFGTIGAIAAGVHRLSDDRHRLRLDRLE